MSTAKVLRAREKILQRGWQLTELFNSDQRCYVTRISGLIVDVGGEPRVWSIQKLISAEEINSSVIPDHEVWVRHFDSLTRQAERYLLEASEKIQKGEYLHVEPAAKFVATESDRPLETRADEGRHDGDVESARDTRSSILDLSGNPIS